MKQEPPKLVVDLDGIDPVISAMERYARERRGWLNIRPEIDLEHMPPPPTPLERLFRSNVYEIAMATWTPPAAGQQNAPQIIGVAHRLGARLVPLLGDLGLSGPDSWKRIQDSPRRGLVMAVPGDEPLSQVLEWLMRMSTAVTRVESTGRWTVSLHEGRQAR